MTVNSEPMTGTEPTPSAEPAKGDGEQGAKEPSPAPTGEGQGGGEGEVEDRHGQPGINREKYQRDMKAKDDKIAELQAQLDEKSKTEEGRANLKAEMEKLKADMADERATYDLKLAGIRDEKAVKAAKAMLPDYGGDVAKLKEDCPYLFDGRKAGSTGLRHEGEAGKAIDAKLDKIFGVED